MLKTSRRRIGPALAVLGAAAVVAVSAVMLWHTEGSRPATPDRPVAQLTSDVPSARRLDAADWASLRHIIQLRGMALAPGRTTLYRSFAAYMGLSGLLALHPVRPGRCATAVSYLYDNLLDLHDAYPGENWRPLRRLIPAQPALGVCAPKAAPRITYAS